MQHPSGSFARRLGASLGLAVVALAAGAVLGPGGSRGVQAASAPVRGVYRFSTTNWKAIADDGFNAVTDGGTNTNNYAGQKAVGLRGMVWLDAYDNSTCKQTMTDSEISSVVRTNVSGGNAGAVYQVGDEPTTNGCAAYSTYVHITSVVHGADRGARTWVADDQFNDPSISHWPAGLPMKGSVDILAFDIYPCQSGPCQLGMIDQAVQRIHSVGLQNWEFILQDFGPCQSWRAPTASEVLQQFQHWQSAGAIGYWVYTFDADNTPCPGNVAGSGVLVQINSMPLGAKTQASPSAAHPSPTGKASPTPTHKPTPTPSPSTSPTQGATSSPQPSNVAEAISQDFGSGPLPLLLIGAGILAALAGIGLNFVRRRQP